MIRFQKSPGLFNVACAALLLSLFVPGRELRAQESSSSTRGSSQNLSVFEGVSVAPSERTDVSRLTDAGILVCDGAVAIVVNVAGELKGRADRDGAIGVLFLPDYAFFDTAYRNKRLLPVSHEANVIIAPGETSYFMGHQQRFEVGFPRYRVLIFNSTGAPATVSVFVYKARA